MCQFPTLLTVHIVFRSPWKPLPGILRVPRERKETTLTSTADPLLLTRLLSEKGFAASPTSNLTIFDISSYNYLKPLIPSLCVYY